MLEPTKYETEEEDEEINIKKLFQFSEGHRPTTCWTDYRSTVGGTVEVKDSRIRTRKRKCQPNR